MTLARVGAVAAVTAGTVLLVMVAVMGALIDAAIRCDRDLEACDWADDDDLTSAERLAHFATLGPVVTIGPNIRSATWSIQSRSQATW